MRVGAPRRRSPPAMVWIGLVIVVLAAGASVFLGFRVWDEANEISSLQAEVASLKSERQAAQGQMQALQATATVLESRLANLEANDPAQQIAALQAAVESATSAEQISELEGSLAEIQARMAGFQGSLDTLATRLEQLSAPAEPMPAQTRLSVPLQKQQHNLSCESSAASMVAQYHGQNLSEAEVLAALPLNDNPHLGFRGNVDGPTGGIEDYGVYAGPVMAILNSRGLRAWLVEGGLAGIRAAVARGNPVIAWVTYNLLHATPVEMTIDGRSFHLVPNQHVVVVTGYDDGGVWANDPYTGQEVYYPAAEFERGMSYFGDMAIEVASP